MGVNKRRYPKEAMARRGEEILEKSIKRKLKGRDPWDVVLIDLETGEYEVDADHMTVNRRLRDRIPDAPIWARRVGVRHLHHLLSPKFRDKRQQRRG